MAHPLRLASRGASAEEIMSGIQPSGSPANVNPDALLSRELGVRRFAANIFNYTVGSGIFSLPAFAVIGLGSAAPLAYVACAIVIALVVLCFAESGSRVSSTGGAYAYVETALGPMAGFVAGCLVFTTGWFAAGAAINAVVRSLLALTSGTPGWVTQVLIVVIVTILVSLNMRGVRSGARLLEAITVAKLVPLLLFIGIGVFFIDTSNLAWASVPAASTVLSTSGIMIYAFSGIEGATVPSGEVKNPARTVPRAILLALGAATVMYLAIQYVALGIMGPALANTGNTPLAEAAGLALGPVARTVMIFGAVVSMFGYLSANVLSEPRGLFAMSRDGFLPRLLTSVHPTFRTPNRAIAIYGVMVLTVALVGSVFADGFKWLTIFANLAALALYFLCAIATLVLRKRDVRTDGQPFVIPGGPLVPVAAMFAIAWLFYETVSAKDGGDQLKGMIIALAVIFLLYGLRALRFKLWPPATAPAK
jgi:APA family basic amino acid/polyamine antiporter